MVPASAPLWLTSAMLPAGRLALRISACEFNRQSEAWLLK